MSSTTPDELSDPWFDEIDDVMRVAVANAIEENRRLGLHLSSEDEAHAKAAEREEESD